MAKTCERATIQSGGKAAALHVECAARSDASAAATATSQ
jgi:hypothetical protein